MVGVRGQGRKFDTQDALRQAMNVFWRNGYEGTSIAELTAAMGIASSSLYAAFQGKKHLFDKVVEYYLAHQGRFVGIAFDEESNTLPLVRRLLFEAAEAYSDQGGPGGCLIVSAATCVTDANRDVEKKLESHRRANIERLENVIHVDMQRGAVSPDVDATSLAEFVGTVLQGMALRGKDGASARSLRATAEMAYSQVEKVVLP